ncbi:hypothetical protein [Streptomyces sp. NPDC059762]|uniref:hypothetical protein n=1 Tax=Streptomyces sp. NPDC059762 TaxID=3346938 RepID=UPI003663E3FD
MTVAPAAVTARTSSPGFTHAGTISSPAHTRLTGSALLESGLAMWPALNQHASSGWRKGMYESPYTCSAPPRR